MFSQQQEEKLVALCQELIRRKSNSGAEKTVAEYLRQMFTQYGYDDFL